MTEADWPAALATVRASLADVPQLQAWFDAELASSPYRPPGRVPLRPDRLGFDGASLHLDAAAFGVTDVAGAARLCEHLLNFRDQPVRYSRSGDDHDVAAMKVADLAFVCDERERAILRLHLTSAELARTVNQLQTVCADREELIQRTDAQARELGQRLRDERRWSLKRPLRAAMRLLTAGRRAPK